MRNGVWYYDIIPTLDLTTKRLYILFSSYHDTRYCNKNARRTGKLARMSPEKDRAKLFEGPEEV